MKILMGGVLDRQNLRHHAKFCGDGYTVAEIPQYFTFFL